ncbi:aminodeoxychorismate synthase component I [Sphingomonas sp.]|uniref:aminodeoxychorismate synthase component I n=1 Tax=Sphingomonas sp. TaxID=28214 RepID=UPI002DF4F70D|nr:aminodeoxychorismate synthase component I [Sphingomonas sp.]HEV2568589.1 aminodeoxychorismate synthase component I [Sphingomonas sp.]
MPPFILLDDARSGAPARLFRKPRQIVRADTLKQVRPSLETLRRAGTHAAGFISYEAAFALEPRLATMFRPPDTPLLWFGLFDDVEEVDAKTWLPDAAGGSTGAPRPLIECADYLRQVDRVQQAIVAGDIYQANLTFRAEVPVAGDPRAIYAGLRQRARASYGALIWTGEDWLLSLSPELFFNRLGDRLTAKPMKGTAAPDADPELLRGDPKQRAENLMIVDLLRNDLSRVAAPGSVSVPELFAVETYPTVQQMTSTVTASLAEGRDTIGTLEALFPCGSITGAPKLRAMEIIAEVEQAPRGIYTGAIGHINPEGEAAFNVAIRTLHLKPGARTATLGLGSGIVADSVPAAEWLECLAKGVFVESDRRFDLIETMGFDPHDGLTRLDRHMARMKASAEAFGFTFDRHAARNELQAATFRLREPSRIRLLASPAGSYAIEVRRLEQPPDTVEVALAPLPVSSDDFRLRHKTTDRGFYDQARRAAGCFEVAFTDTDGFLTEGSFTSIFVERDGMLLTPPLSRGMLPGVLRAELIETGRAVEADLRAEDLSGDFFMGNSARGLLRARLRSV